MTVGMIGLGVMGSAMAMHLANAGRLSAVWNRTQARGQKIAADLNVDQTDDLASLADCSDVLITCVSADADLQAVIAELMPSLRAGQIVVDTSTVGVATVEALAATLSDQGVSFVDAPVTGGAEGAQAGTLQVMAGGDDAALTAVRPALEAFATSVTHFGPVGSGQRAKAVNQVLAAGMVQAMTEALAFADASGLDTEALLPVLSQGAMGSQLLSRRGERVLAADFAPGFRMALHHKDLQLCRTLLQSMDVNLPLVEMTVKHYERLMDQGYGDEDMSALYRLKRELFTHGNRKSL
ncbi:MAG: NAD(P)-dependent oxidoreductase [Spiribacter sp.]|nr:NAD(P)-dependent oxidoreductase [Spiribacter sp.]MDR9480092.1 NAD(P)-dependent oxidoreductase [Spiribacter sp.]